MARSCQPTFVADRESRLHIEDRLLTGSAKSPVSVTRCGLQLKRSETTARVFFLSYRHLFVEGCEGCRDA